MKKYVLALAAASLAFGQNPEAELRKAFATKTGSVTLPAGTIEIAREIVIPPDAQGLEIHGAKTTIKAAGTFRGRALLVITAAKKVHIDGLSLDGNRDQIGRMMGLPPSETPFSRFVPNNGILAEDTSDLEIGGVKASNVAGFAILVNAGHGVRIHNIEITIPNECIFIIIFDMRRSYTKFVIVSINGNSWFIP